MRPRPSAALVVAILALFVSLSGTALAAVVISSNHQVAAHTIAGANAPSGDNKNLIPGSVGSGDLHAGAVGAAQLATNAVTSTKVAADSLTGADVKESTLGIVPNASEIGGLAPSALLTTSDVQRFDYSKSGCQSATDAGCTRNVVTLGGLTLRATCFNANPSSDATLAIEAIGPAGSVMDSAFIVHIAAPEAHHAEQDGQLVSVTASGTNLPKDETGTIVYGDAAGHRSVSVTFSGHEIEPPTDFAQCHLYGTAMLVTG